MTHPSRRTPLPQPGEALFAATGAGTSSLLIGGPARSLRDVIAALGGQTVETGPFVDDRLNEVGDAGPRLPFADASFDSVFALYPSMAEHGGPEGVRRARDLARECARVLRPGGRLVVSVPNPRLLAALRFVSVLCRGPLGSLLPATVEDKVRLHQASPAILPYSRRRLTRLLRRAGFEKVAGYGMWPRAGAWSSLLPDTGAGLGERLQRARLQRTLPGRAAGLLGAAPARFVIAQTPCTSRATGNRAGPPVLESILSDAEWDGSTISAPAIRTKAQSAAFTTVGDSFYKIALTPAAAERQRAETAAHAQLSEGGAGRFMVDLRRAGELGSLHYAVHAAAETIDDSDEAVLLAAQAEAFTLLGEGAVLRPLDSTASWSRILTGASRVRLEQLGGADLCAHMEQAVGRKTVLAGNVHGDLHHYNVMRHAGRTVLIDWDRFESASPLIIDRCNSIHRLMARRFPPERGEERHLAVLHLMSRRDSSVPLLSCVDEAAGELSWPEVMLVHVLSASSWRLIGPGGHQAGAERDVRAYIAFGLGLLD